MRCLDFGVFVGLAKPGIGWGRRRGQNALLWMLTLHMSLCHGPAFWMVFPFSVFIHELLLDLLRDAPRAPILTFEFDSEPQMREWPPWISSPSYTCGLSVSSYCCMLFRYFLYSCCALLKIWSLFCTYSINCTFHIINKIVHILKQIPYWIIEINPEKLSKLKSNELEYM